MSTHPYLRAYLAGIFVTTLILPLILTAFIVVRLILQLPVPIERGLIFPMALVPALWGLWNMLWLASHERTHLTLGPHGAIFPFLLLPCGALVAHCFGILSFAGSSVTWFQSIQVPYLLIVPAFCCGVAAYYLVWKYIVGFVNRVLGIV
jgi:hypothetical protein